MPITFILKMKNLKKGTQKNPAIIEQIDPFSVNFSQNKDSRIVGQKVAAIPDHPNITNQKIVLSGESNATDIAMVSAVSANNNVIIFEILASCFSVLFGLNICW